MHHRKILNLVERNQNYFRGMKIAPTGFLIIFLTIIFGGVSALGQQVVGYQRVVVPSAGDNVAVDDLARFDPIPFESPSGGWTLDELFPAGAGVTVNNGGQVGTVVYIMQESGGNLDFSNSPSFTFDGSQWVNSSNAAAGSEVIAVSSRVLLRQPSDVSISPIVAGVVSTSTDSPLHASLNYVSNTPEITSVQAQQGGEMLVEWSEAAGATGYRVYRSSTNSFGDASLLGTVNGTSYSDTGAISSGGFTFYYWVQAIKSSGDVASVAPFQASLSISEGDMDFDGVDDLVLQDSTGEIVFWHMGGGAFGNVKSQSVLTDAVGSSLEVVGHSDFDSDGHVDLVLRDTSSGDVVVWSLSGSSTKLEGSGVLETSPTLEWQVSGVFKNEILFRNRITGQSEVWTIGSYNSVSDSYPVSATLSLPVQVTDLNWLQIGMNDFNADGNADIFWQNVQTGSKFVWYLRPDKSVIASGVLGTQLAGNSWHVQAFGDFDGDGDLDMTFQNIYDERVFLWQMGPSFENVVEGSGLASAQPRLSQYVRNTRPDYGMVSGHSEFTSRGVDDLVLQDDTGLITFQHLSRTQFAAVESSSTNSDAVGQNLKVVGSSDFDGDMKADLVLRNEVDGSVHIWPMNGNSRKGTGVGTLAGAPSLEWELAGVFKKEMIFRNSQTGNAAIWQIGSFDSVSSTYLVQGTTLLPVQVADTSWILIGINDFNGDGNVDVFWQSVHSGSKFVWYLKSDKSVLASGVLGTQLIGNSWRVVGFGDWDGDSDLDVAFNNIHSGAVFLWQMGKSFEDKVDGGGISSSQPTGSQVLRNSRSLQQ